MEMKKEMKSCNILMENGIDRIIYEINNFLVSHKLLYISWEMHLLWDSLGCTMFLFARSSRVSTFKFTQSYVYLLFQMALTTTARNMARVP